MDFLTPDLISEAVTLRLLAPQTLYTLIDMSVAPTQTVYPDVISNQAAAPIGYWHVPILTM